VGAILLNSPIVKEIFSLNQFPIYEKGTVTDARILFSAKVADSRFLSGTWVAYEEDGNQQSVMIR